MTRRRSIIGALVLCALSLCALGAASASAAGLTAVKCVEVAAGTGNYETSHCETPKKEKGNFDTVALTETTEGEAVGVGTAVLTTTIAGVKLNITCEELHTTSGDVKNVEEEGEMRAHGTNIVLHTTGCQAASVANPAKKCEVEGVSGGSAGKKGEFESNALTTITGPEHKVTFSAEAGGNFTVLKILKGECLGATTEVKVTGTLIGIANTEKHSHITLTPATNGTGMKANGSAATVEATIVGHMTGTEETIGLETF